ncbi:MAG TPA: oligopeptide/dipeptide ABC transporter ATP-binding protein [Stellaceae bacterium]|nr:oligopeptide/dipeptide ABC transporter ATP-binding protein [Stellaceae bacterium]
MKILMRGLGLSIRFPANAGAWFGRRHIHAVRDVDFEVAQGETLAIIGESGCGKSTLVRAAIGLQPLDDGQVLWRGIDMAAAPPTVRQRFRRDIQMIFQDPAASFDPRMSIQDSVAAPLAVHEPECPPTERRQRVVGVLERVGLDPILGHRLPHQLSGGQCQRAAIARALILSPALIVCDEPLASLDVSIQAQIVNLLLDLQRSEGLTLLLVSHNLPVVRRMAHRVMVMHLGEVVETGPAAEIFARPRHPYTRALIAAVPEPDPAAPHPAILPGEMPSPLALPKGCAFASRCPQADKDCRRAAPALDRTAGTHQVACFKA